MEPFGSAERPVVMAHRGSPLRAPENTPASFAAAVAEGATWVELDARRSADGVVVVHHDPETADGAPVVERSAAELRTLDVWDLATVLAELPGGVGVDVELKNLPGEPDYDEEERLGELVAAVLAAGAGRRPLLVSSFNPSTALAAAAGLAGVPAGLLSLDTLELHAAADVAAELGFGVLCPHAGAPGLDREGVAAARARGLALLVWTVDDPRRARALAGAGVDALCTNDPAGVLAALGRGPARA